MSNFQPLEVVGRGSETQPQVAENLNKFTQQDKGYFWWSQRRRRWSSITTSHSHHKVSWRLRTYNEYIYITRDHCHTSCTFSIFWFKHKMKSHVRGIEM